MSRARARVSCTALATFAVGCAAAQMPSPAPAPPGPCALPLEAGVGPDDLGFSLARLSPEVPHTTAGLAALVAQHAAGAIRLERLPADATRPWLGSVAGGAPCSLDDERLARLGSPPRLVQPPRHPTVDERLRAGAAALTAQQWPEARAALVAAARLAPDTPEARLRVGDAYATEGRWSQAAATYQAAVAAFPWSFSARFRLGQALRVEGQVTEGVRTLARALALRPGSAELRAELERERAAEVIPPAPPPALRAEDGGGVRWVVPDRPGVESGTALEEAAAYARCKEAFRQSEPLRLAAAGLAGARWRWSVAEETTCTVLWLASYLAHREQGRASDPDLDVLAAIMQNGQIDERSLFDVGGAVHPQATAFLDDAARERLFQFVLTRRAGRRAGEGWLLP